MKTVTIRELSREASASVRQVTDHGEPVLITKRGVPVAIILPVDLDKLGDHLTDTAPAYIDRGRRQAAPKPRKRPKRS
jgi:prevent-host-death family protein